MTILVAAPQAGLQDSAELKGVVENELFSLDVEAYFPQGPFRTAQRMIARRDTAQGVRLLRRLLREQPNAPERPQARYLLGLGLIGLGEYEEAARLFDELASSYPLLRDDHLFFRGQALYLWGSYLDAAETLARVDPEGARGEEARRLMAWALLRATDFERLVRWLETEKDVRPLEPELVFVLAQARHRTGDILGAYRGFREVWRQDAGKFSGRALAHIATLKIGERWMVGAAERRAILDLDSKLRSGVDVDRTLGDLQRRLSRTGNRRLLAEVEYARGRYAEARRRFRTAEGHYRSAQETAPVEMVELRARIGLALGHVLEWLGSERHALETYRMVAQRFADRPEAEDALIAAAEIQVRGRKYEDAQRLCEQLLLGNPVTKHRRRCLWTVGWAHFRLGQYTRARQFFGSLSRMELSAEMDGAAKYWLARTNMTVGRLEEASDLYKAILKRYPLSYYAALAEEQLTEALDEARVAKTKVTAEAPEALPPKLLQVREYVRLGLRSRALAALMTFEKAERKRPGKIEKSIYYAMAHLYEELRHPLDARKMREECARVYPTSLGDEAFVEAAKKAHPLKYEEVVRKQAEAFQLPESLLFALIRTESGFSPTAVSPMNAYGLAQLIMPTAKAVSARLGAGRPTKKRLLYDLNYNVRLGAAYLRQMLDRYEGSEVLALAAYNAGPSAVDAWLRRRVRALTGVKGSGIGVQPAPDELAEEIPVAETRRYVKGVLARARGYARLYARPKKVVRPPPELEVAAYAEPIDLPAKPRMVPDAPTGAAVWDRRYVVPREAEIHERPLAP